MPTHVIYIDDSGTKEYANNPDEYRSNSGNSRYFVFGGALVSTVTAGQLSSIIIKHKLDVFGTDSVEIKSNWLRIPKERKRRYLAPYGISETELNDFVEKYYQAILNSDATFIAAVVDKLHMQEDYKTPYYAPAVSYECLLTRVEKHQENVGDYSVIIDDMDGATVAGNQYKENLKRQHSTLKQRGSRLQKGFKFNRLTGSIKFVNSSHSHLVQVADIAAYNVYRQFVEHGEKWEDTAFSTNLPVYAYFEKITCRFRQDGNGRIQGYGIIKLPMRKKIRWGISK